MAKKYKHFFLKDNVVSEKFKLSPSRGPEAVIPGRNRVAHSRKLLQQFDKIWKEKESLQIARTAESIATREGTYLSFTSALDSDLITKSLENIKKGIRLLNIKEEIIDDEKIQVRATIYIPSGMEKFFMQKIEEYQKKDTKLGNPKNAPLVNSIEDISIALLEGLWTDNPSLIPGKTYKWCEVWLNIQEAAIDNQIEEFSATLNSIGIEYKPNSIIFPERAVLLINANRTQLVELMLQSELLAEFRAGQETAGFWVNETSAEQEKWAEDLLKRLEIADDSKVKVCILDTGVNNGHQLLKPLITDTDTLTVNPTWGTNDHGNKNGHGTMMAGIAGYGNFEKELIHNNKVLVTHKLCSVKLLPPPSVTQTPQELWGYMTSQAISIAEIRNPDKVLLYCMAIASEDDVDRGRPSSWSGAVDNLAYGEGETPRLIIISAGNVDDVDSYIDYPNVNFVSSVLNPAQAWNALVVGAHTEKVIVKDAAFNNHTPLANVNQLSPYSTTSLVWEKKWPAKPDVVFEGGNLLKTPDNRITAHPDLDLLSTSKNFNLKPLDTFWATSAATAQASWFAAKIAYDYPNIWAETLRGLIVHSASWTPEMLNQMNVKPGNRGDYKKLLQVFGYGVPDLEKALYSNESALTYITQENIQPYNFKFKDGRKTTEVETNQIHFYDLPWPKDLLLSLGNLSVRLKITLSYFIEPGVGEIGWKDKYRYQSFGLRFDVNNVGEKETVFKKRINAAAREENEKAGGNSGSDRWIIGTNNRSSGSIHSDFWEGTAAELSTCNLIGVFPVIGWWRERKHLNKVETQARYSLIISLETPTQSQEIGLYTAVKNMIETTIEIKTK